MGSVHAYESAAGKRYRVAFRKPDHSQGLKRGFKTKRDAELYLASVEVSKAKGEFVDATAARATVDTLGTEWLAHQSHLKPSSLRPVEIAWRLHVQPVWGTRGVGGVRHSEVQAWVTDLTSRKGATTVLRAYGVLAALLDVAVRDRRIPANPARGVNLPRKTGKARVYLTHGQVQLLSDNAKHHGTLVLFLAYTGLRWGEATGLRVRSLDALRRRVNVTENAVAVGGKIVVGTPKSHTARSVPYPAFLSEPLAKLCEGKARDALLFGAGVEYVRLPDSRLSWFTQAVAKSQAVDKSFERVTIHDLRHTAASLAISAGANVKAVQRMLGHASAAMTLDTYADLFEDDLDAVAEALNDAKVSTSVVKVLSDRRAANAETP
ncbi:MAG: tyrosine-type recombinase/integrase [Rhodoglobus sp.]